MKLLAAGIILLISYSVLVLQFYIASRKGYNNTTDVVHKRGNLAVLNQRHLVSLLAMGFAAAWVGFLEQEWLLLHAIANGEVLLLTVVASIAAALVSVTAARKALQKQDQITGALGSAETYLFLRCLFLIVYEIFFRGVLFSFCIAVTNIPLAIVINVMLYAIAHAFSTRQELAGTIPFGILLCLLTLFSGSVWPALIIHLLLGLPYDVLILSAPKPKTKTFIS
jgi:membrane protease YdiL (CAAX protease family)